MFLESCAECLGSDDQQPSTLALYHEYLDTNLIPTIKEFLKKYSIWWTLKPTSSLNEFITDLPQYFCPDELCDKIVALAKKRNMMDIGNGSVIISDRTLFNSFNTWMIYVPDLKVLCEPHIDYVYGDVTTDLQNTAICNEIYITPPEAITWTDKSSVFWLHPDINLAMNNNQKLVYSGLELYNMFVQFCKTNTKHITCIGKMMYQINPTSQLTKLFKFKVFHFNQIPDILKMITKYLGKTNTIEHCCNNFKPTINASLHNIIEFPINNYNKDIPFVYTYHSL